MTSRVAIIGCGVAGSVLGAQLADRAGIDLSVPGSPGSRLERFLRARVQ